MLRDLNITKIDSNYLNLLSSNINSLISVVDAPDSTNNNQLLTAIQTIKNNWILKDIGLLNVVDLKTVISDNLNIFTDHGEILRFYTNISKTSPLIFKINGTTYQSSFTGTLDINKIYNIRIVSNSVEVVPSGIILSASDNILINDLNTKLDLAFHSITPEQLVNSQYLGLGGDIATLNAKIDMGFKMEYMATVAQKTNIGFNIISDTNIGVNDVVPKVMKIRNNVISLTEPKNEDLYRILMDTHLIPTQESEFKHGRKVLVDGGFVGQAYQIDSTTPGMVDVLYVATITSDNKVHLLNKVNGRFEVTVDNNMPIIQITNTSQLNVDNVGDAIFENVGQSPIAYKSRESDTVTQSLGVGEMVIMFTTYLGYYILPVIKNISLTIIDINFAMPSTISYNYSLVNIGNSNIVANTLTPVIFDGVYAEGINVLPEVSLIPQESEINEMVARYTLIQSNATVSSINNVLNRQDEITQDIPGTLYMHESVTSRALELSGVVNTHGIHVLSNILEPSTITRLVKMSSTGVKTVLPFNNIIYGKGISPNEAVYLVGTNTNTLVLSFILDPNFLTTFDGNPLLPIENEPAYTMIKDLVLSGKDKTLYNNFTAVYKVDINGRFTDFFDGTDVTYFEEEIILFNATPNLVFGSGIVQTMDQTINLSDFSPTVKGMTNVVYIPKTTQELLNYSWSVQSPIMGVSIGNTVPVADFFYYATLVNGTYVLGDLIPWSKFYGAVNGELKLPHAVIDGLQTLLADIDTVNASNIPSTLTTSKNTYLNKLTQIDQLTTRYAEYVLKLKSLSINGTAHNSNNGDITW